MTLKESKHLLSVIFMAMVFKVITSDDIEYDKGMIQSIDGIKFSKGKVIVDRDLYDIDNNNTTANIILEKKNMSDNWTKYLKDLKRNII